MCVYGCPCICVAIHLCVQKASAPSTFPRTSPTMFLPNQRFSICTPIYRHRYGRRSQTMKTLGKKEWVDWTMNLYFSITDGLSNVASFPAMRTAIEEAALSTNSVSTTRKLDSLRVQKGILQGTDLSQQRERTDLSLRHLSLAVMACRRVLRIAGLVPSTLTFEKVDTPSQPVSPVLAKNPSPILSSFVE